MSSLIKFSHYSKRILRPVQLIRCHISTSKKSQEVCVTNAEIAEQEPYFHRVGSSLLVFSCLSLIISECGIAWMCVVTATLIYFKQKQKRNWQSYGFEKDNETEDLNAMHATGFFSITLCLVGGIFMFAYMPDYNYKNWAERQAFLELRRREDQGLPLIDPNYIQPSLIKLPSEEELGDTEIVI